MESNLDHPQLKKLLSDLEEEHKHLELSINHLEIEIEKREIEIRKLLTERGLDLCLETHLVEPREDKPPTRTYHSSEFAKQVAHVLDEITRTADEVTSLIKL